MNLHKIRNTLVALTIAGVAFMPIGVQAQSDFGPDRPTFTWSHPASYVTFNSITDNPVVGDERAFYNAYDASGSSSNASHNVNVTDNEEVALRVFYHNNAAANLNLVAFNTRVKMALPTSAATTQSSVAYISADNANPGSVFDTVHLNGSSPFTLDYEAGTAKLYNNVFNGTPLSDSIVTSQGAQIGFDQINGQVPGCANFSGYVIIKVRVHMQQPPAPAFSCDAFNITADVNRSVKVSTFSTTATNGAAFKNAVVNWGDNSSPLTSANIVGQTHQYAADGTYTVTATAHFTVNGQDMTAGGPQCQKQVTFSSTTPPKVTPPPSTPATPAAPTALVNTGPGSVAAIFGAATAAGTVLYRRMLSRRLSRQ